MSANDCDSLPDRLQGGCYWRWNWARGDINGWNVEVRNLTSCPSHLTDICTFSFLSVPAPGVKLTNAQRVAAQVT